MHRSTRFPGRLPALLVAALGFLAVPLSADTIHKTNGTKVEGKVTEENATEVVIQTKFGELRVPRNEIDRIEKGMTSTQEFKQRWDEVDKKDALALLDLADWCNANGLGRETKKVYREVLNVEPDNEQAREALGYVLSEDGEWKTKAEIARAEREAKKEAAKSSKGSGSGSSKAKKGGSTPIAIGDVDEDVRKMVEPIVENQAADQKIATELEDFFGQRFSVATSENFSLRAQLPPQDTQEHVTIAERVLAKCNKRFGLPADQKFWTKNPYLIFHVKQKGTFQDLIDWLDKNVFELTPEEKKHYKDTGGLINSGMPMASQYEREVPLKNAISQWVGQTYMYYYSRGGARTWLIEGFGMYTAIEEYGVSLLTFTTRTKYENAVEIADKNSDTAYRLVCLDIVDGKVGTERSYAWNELRMRSLNDLDFADLAKCWSLCDFLMSQHREEFMKYLSILVRHQDEEQALREAFGWSGQELDERWTDFVRENYSRS